MIPALLAQIGLPLLVRAVGAGLEKINHPAASGAAQALIQVGEALGSGQIAPESVTEANRHVERLAELDTGQTRDALAQINTSLRAEAASEDAFVRRMRPTFGYAMAVAWMAQMGAVAWVMVADPNRAGTVIGALESLSTIWSVGLGVLGIYVYRRSGDKRVTGR